MDSTALISLALAAFLFLVLGVAEWWAEEDEDDEPTLSRVVRIHRDAESGRREFPHRRV